MIEGLITKGVIYIENRKGELFISSNTHLIGGRLVQSQRLERGEALTIELGDVIVTKDHLNKLHEASCHLFMEEIDKKKAKTFKERIKKLKKAFLSLDNIQEGIYNTTKNNK